MGLKILNFKKGGQTFTDAYAKVSGVRYDNDSKIASFGIKVYTSKEDKNLITEIPHLWAKIEAGTDMVAQCYLKINANISQTKNHITAKQAAIDATLDDDNAKLRLEFQLNQMLKNELLQFDEAVEF